MSIRIVFSLFLVVLMGCSASSGPKLNKGEEVFPARFFQLSDGSPLFFEDLKGKTVVIAFWATHCTASNPVMKRLSRFAERFQNDERIQFVAVSLDEPAHVDKLRERIKYEDFNSMAQMFSGNEGYDEAYQALKGERLPYVVILDRNGRVVDSDTDDDIVYEYIKVGKPMPVAVSAAR